LTRLRCALILFSLALGSGCGARVLYVNGTPIAPIHDGASWQTACTTISAALTMSAPGDEVWVAQGTYTENLLIPARVALYGGFAGGESSRDLSVRHHTTTVNGSGMGNTVRCTGDGIVLDGFTILNAAEAGVRVTGGEVTLANNTITGNKDGIHAEAARLSVSGCRIRFNREHGVYLYSYCTFSLAGSLFNGNRTALYAYDQNSGTITHNVIYDNGSVLDTHAENLVLENNSISRNGSLGYVHRPGVVTLNNNTLVDNHGSLTVYPAAAVRMVNNVVAYMASLIYAFGDDPVPVFRCNAVYETGPSYGFPVPEGQGNITGNPLFVDSVHGDYRLQAGSPCINAGDPSVAPPGAVDLDGRPRTLGGRVDMGAYEYPAPGYFTMDDAAACLRIAGGMQGCSPQEIARLDVDASGIGLNARDAARLARKAAGLESNP